MTVIIASLFLPYTVEFKLNQEVDQNLIKNLTVEKKFQSQQQQPPPPQLQTRPSASILSRSHISAANVNDLKTANSSVEDFFNQPSTLSSPKGSAEMYSNSNISTGSFKDELSNRLSVLNRSSSSAFVPKSTVNKSLLRKSVNDSEVNLSKLAKAQKTLKKRSTLKYEQVNHIDDDADDDDDAAGAYSSVSSETHSDDEDDRYDSLYNHKVPKFGGFSKKNVLGSASNESNEIVFKDFDIIPFSKGNGALKTAVKTTLTDYKWVGTIGIPTDRVPELTKALITRKLYEDYKCESVLPSDSTFQGHYKNFCKQILWPTLHYQIPDNPNSKAFEDHSWEFYKKLNQDFAEKLLEIYQDGDVIWIHDYHLFLLPQMIRERLPNAKIGFFLHVSFPSSELFKCFAQREYLLQGILGANFISFQTEEYCRHFAQTCNKLLLADISNHEIRYKGSVSQIASFPVGIDAKTLTEEFQKSESIKPWREMIRDRWTSGTKLIVCRDKLDRIRGVKQKLLSYEMFLKNNPEYIEKTTLIQICLRSSTNMDTRLESEIMLIVDRINSLAPNISSSTQPVVFLHQDIEFIQYLALIAEADCFIVSSMREGMNLTCHEFIVATESKQSPLVLSEFTGSAAVFSDDDVFKINPWDLKQFSNAIKDALELPADLKKLHWKHLIDVVQHQDCSNWVNSNLEKIQESWKFEIDKKLLNYQIFNFETFYKCYKDSSDNGKRLFILNLSNITPSERLLKILHDLTLDSNNEVYIFSNFKLNEMERYYRVLLPSIGIIGENGGLIKLANNDKSWISLVNVNSFRNWVKNSKKLLSSFEERLPGSFFEIGHTFIKFHTESCHDKSLIDPERKSSLIGDLISHINDFDHKENESSFVNRSDSIVSTTSTASSTFNSADSDDLKIHATLSEDGIIYVEQVDISLIAINFLIDYYSNAEILQLVDHNLKFNDNEDVIDIGAYSTTFLPSPANIPVTPNTSRTIRQNHDDRSAKVDYFNYESSTVDDGVRLLTIAGNRNIFFDSIFDYIGEKTADLKHDKKVKNIFTIGYENGVDSRGAREYVVGLNELFSILKRLTS